MNKLFKTSLLLGLGLVLVVASGCSKMVSMRTIEVDRVHDVVEFKRQYDAAAMNDPDKVVGLACNAYLEIEKSKEAGWQMSAVVAAEAHRWNDAASPVGVKPSKALEFYLDQFAKSPVIMRSFVGGDGPPNYTLSNPERLVIKVEEVQNTTSDTRRKYFLKSSGKDNASPIEIMRETSGGPWVVISPTSLAAGVRR